MISYLLVAFLLARTIKMPLSVNTIWPMYFTSWISSLGPYSEIFSSLQSFLQICIMLVQCGTSNQTVLAQFCLDQKSLLGYTFGKSPVQQNWRYINRNIRQLMALAKIYTIYSDFLSTWSHRTSTAIHQCWESSTFLGLLLYLVLLDQENSQRSIFLFNNNEFSQRLCKSTQQLFLEPPFDSMSRIEVLTTSTL